MGVSTAGHLPGITSTSFPALVHSLQATRGAQRSVPWTITIRMLRSHMAWSSQDQGRGMRTMYVVQLSEFPAETFVLVEDNARPTRAVVKGRVDARRARDKENGKSVKSTEAPVNAIATGADASTIQNQVGQPAPAVEQQQENQGAQTSNGTHAAPGPGDAGDQEMSRADALADIAIAETEPKYEAKDVAGPTRQVLFCASAHYMLLLARLNLPPPLGAPVTGEGAVLAGPGAWLPRGAPITIQGHVYEVPSTSQPIVGGSGSDGNHGGEWRVRLGMVQSGTSRTSGAIVENEYLPLMHINDEVFLTSYLHNLFPVYLTDPAGQTAAKSAMDGTMAPSGVIAPLPLPSQWAEVVPASHDIWLSGVEERIADEDSAAQEVDAAEERKRKRKRRQLYQDSSLQAPHAAPDHIGWQGKERGRRVAFMYITLLRNQGLL